MKSVLETLKLAASHLEKNSVARPRRVTEELLAHVLGCDRTRLYMQFDRPLNKEELDTFRSYISRAAKHEPKEYIIGEVSFFDCTLEVSPSVLIPRQETEILLDKVFERLAGAHEVWDLCTGSGCLAIGVKKKFPHLHVCASDLSLDAIEVARRNAKSNEIDVQFYQGDLLEPFEGRKADVILCNPPYISEVDYAALDTSVSHFEPKMALVGGRSGLEIYERLSRDLPRYLNAKAKLFFEIGYDQAESVNQIFNSPFWVNKEILQDYARHDRFFFLEIE